MFFALSFFVLSSVLNNNVIVIDSEVNWKKSYVVMCCGFDFTSTYLLLGHSMVLDKETSVSTKRYLHVNTHTTPILTVQVVTAPGYIQTDPLWRWWCGVSYTTAAGRNRLWPYCLKNLWPAKVRFSFGMSDDP